MRDKIREGQRIEKQPIELFYVRPVFADVFLTESYARWVFRQSRFPPLEFLPLLGRCGGTGWGIPKRVFTWRWNGTQRHV